MFLNSWCNRFLSLAIYLSSAPSACLSLSLELWLLSAVVEIVSLGYFFDLLLALELT